MPGTNFQRPVNHFSTTLSAQHTSGSGSFALQSGDGALLGALGANEVYRITLLTSPGASETIVGIFECTGISTNTLTGGTAVEGYSDSTIASGTTVQVRATAKTFSDIHTLLHGIEVLSETSITSATTISTAASSFNKSYVCSGTSANYAVTLPAITSGAYEGMVISLRMSSALTKLVTITAASGETVGGLASRVMWANESASLVARGTNWVKQSGANVPIFGRLSRVATNVTGIPVGGATWTGVALDTVVGPAFLLSGGNFVAPRAGNYCFDIFLYVNNVTGVYIGMSVNGANSVPFACPAIIGGIGATTFAAIVSLSAGDTVVPATYVLSSGGGGVDIPATTSPATLDVAEVISW